MFDAQSAFNNGLEMLDGAFCQFMGSDAAAITQKDEDGQAQSLTLDAATIIPTGIDHDPRAHLRRPIVMMRQG